MHARIAGVSPTALAVDRPLGNAAGHGCSSALLSGEHCWSGGLRYCWLMSLILPGFFLNALLLPSPLLPLPALSLSISLSQTHTGVLPLPPPSHDVMQARSPIATASPITPLLPPSSTPHTSSSSGWIFNWCKEVAAEIGCSCVLVADFFHCAPPGAIMKISTLKPRRFP